MKTILFLLIYILSINQVYTQTKFAVIGDYGKHTSAEGDVANLIKSWNVDFIVTTGDNSYGSNPIDYNVGYYYADFINPYFGSYGQDTASVNRFWASIGNHDYSDGGGINAYVDYFSYPNNERYYDIILDNIHLFIINSIPDEPDGKTENSIQGQWITARMTECFTNHNHWRIAAFHYPPYSSGNHGSIEFMRWNFQNYGIHAVLSGHDHTFERLTKDGVMYFVNGLGGKSIYNFNNPIPESQFRYNSDYGAQLVTVDGIEMKMEFYNRSGELIDSYIITDADLPPELLSATINTPAEVTLFFSESLDSQSAQNENNYSINNGINVISAVLNTNNRDVILTTSAHDTNQTYTVTVSNVMDLSGNVISPNHNSADYQFIIISEPIFPVDLFGTPEFEKTVSVDLSLPGIIPNFLTYNLIAFDPDHGGNDPPEGHAFINGNGPLELFPGATQANGDGQTNSFAFSFPSSWWVNGLNELKFVRLYSTGYRIDSAYVSLNGATDVQEEDNIPNDFTLGQNYPNPFNPSTSISFSLPADSKVRLSVYNLLGELVEEIANEEFSAGTHTLSFNSDGLTSGVYFYRLKAGTFIATRKMSLLR